MGKDWLILDIRDREEIEEEVDEIVNTISIVAQGEEIDPINIDDIREAKVYKFDSPELARSSTKLPEGAVGSFKLTVSNGNDDNRTIQTLFAYEPNSTWQRNWETDHWSPWDKVINTQDALKIVEDYGKLSKENKTKIEELEQKKADKDRVDQQIRDVVTEIVAGADKDFDTLKEISDWIGSHTESAAEMNSRITQNEKDIDSLENRMSAAESDIDNLEATTEKHGKDIDSLKAADKEINDNINAFKTEVKNTYVTQTEYNAEVEELESSITILNEEDDRLQSEIDALQAKDNSLDSDIAGLREKDKEQDERLTSIEDTNTKQEAHLTEIDTKNEEQDTHLGQIDTKNDEQDERLTNLETKDEQHEARMTDIETNVSNFKKEVSDTYVTKNEYNDEVTILESTIDKLDDEDTRLQGEIDSLVDKDASLDSDIKDLRDADKEHDSQILELQNKDTQHDSQISDLNDKDTEHDTKIKALETKDTTHENRMSQIESKNATQDSQITALENKLNGTIGSDDEPVYLSEGIITTTGKKFSEYLSRSGGTMTGTINSQAITPTKDNTYDLGNSTSKYKDVYATNFHGALKGNADTATKLSSAKNIALSGDATGNANFDGSSGITIPTTLALTGVEEGSYGLPNNVTPTFGDSFSVPYLTIDEKGRTTEAVNHTVKIPSYSVGTGLSLSGTTFTNTGVTSVTTGKTNGTVSVTTNGTTTDVSVKGLGSAAYTSSDTYAPKVHTHAATDIVSGTLNVERLPSIPSNKLTGTIPSNLLPSYVDDTIEGYLSGSKFYKEAAHTTEITGETGKIYVDLSSNKTYRWSGTAYVEISASLALGETSSTAFRGDQGKTAYQHATAKGGAFASNLYKITTNDQGHVTAATAVTKQDITNLGIPGADTDTKVNVVANTTTKAYLLATTTTPPTTATGTTAVADSGVYLDTTAGSLTATTFKGNLTGNVTGTVSGNAGTATKLANQRTISLTNDVTGSAKFDGSGDAAITATLKTTGVEAGSYGQAENKTLGFGGTFAVPYLTIDDKGRTTVAASHTVTLPAAPTSVSGNAGTATKLATARKISLTGDVTGNTTFDGAADKSITTALSTTGVTASTYGPPNNTTVAFGGTIAIPFFTVDAKGRLSAAGNRTITMMAAPTNITGNAATATTATKLGTTSVGSNTKHFYLNNGTPTASTANVGDSDTPVYLTGGNITASTKKFSQYLPLAGGTMTGPISLNSSSKTKFVGIKYWSPSYYTWGTYMAQPGDTKMGLSGGATQSFGDVTLWALRTHIENGSGYGWIWESSQNASGASPVPVMALNSNNGNLTVKGTITAPTFKGTLNGNAGTATKLATARKINTILFDGTKDIDVPRSIVHIHKAQGTNGKNGWVKVAKITVIGSYANHPIRIVFAQRRYLQSTIHIVFTNDGSATVSGLETFKIDSPDNRATSPKLVQSGQVWSLWIQKCEAYDHIYITDFTKADGDEGNSYTVEWVDEFSETDPGGTAASRVCGTAISAETATTATYLGKSTVGSTTTPMYLNTGVATVCTGRTVPGIKSLSTATHLSWGTNNSYVVDLTTLAYWNGRYNESNSNLSYCKNGEIVGTTGNQTIAGTKTFSSTINGSVSGNSGGLTNKTLNSTTINNTAGTFSFQGDGAPWVDTDWVGLQVDSGADKFQICANGNTLIFRQNDNKGTNTPWNSWVTFATQEWANSKFLPLAGGTMTGTINSQTIQPKTDKTYNLGSTSYKFSNIYTHTHYSDDVVVYMNDSVSTAVHIKAATGAANHTATLQAKTGTIALTSDLPSGTWTAVSTITDATNVTSHTVKYKKWGDVVEISVQIQPKSSQSQIKLFTLPEGYRPNNTRLFGIHTVSGGAVAAALKIETSGLCTLQGTGPTALTTTTYFINGIFLV